MVLRDLEGLSYGEMARVTRLSPGTVASRLNRARQRLAREVVDLDGTSRRTARRAPDPLPAAQ